MDLDNFIIDKTKESRGEIWQKSNSCLTNIERTIVKKIYQKLVVAVVEASETCQSSFDHELGASRHQTKKRDGNVGAADNDAKLLTSS